MILQLAWCAVALYGLTRAVLLFREAIADKKALGAEDESGKRILADWQVEHGWMGVVIYFFLLAAGLCSLAYHAGGIAQSVAAIFVPSFLVLALLALVVRQDRDASYRRRNLEVGFVRVVVDSHLDATAKDTNETVRRIEKRLDDQ